MAAKRTPGSKPGLIYCEHCGEEYSESYRRCPFCDEYDEYENTEPTTRLPRNTKGKRVAPSRRRGGGYSGTSPLSIVIYILSLAIIVVFAYIVLNYVVPLIQRGNIADTPIDDPPSQTITQQPEETPELPPEETSELPPEETPEVTEPPVATPAPSPSANPGDANGLSLNKKEFSITARYPDPVTLKVTFSPAGTNSPVTWSSSNTNYVTVDQNGKVSAGPQKGTATITAALPNGVTQTCKVHNEISGGTSTPEPAPSQSTDNTTYKINKSDFTFYRRGESTKLKAVDYTGGISWSSSNTSVATVDSDGTCKAVGNGTCTITGTLDNGTTIKAIARVSIS